MMLYALGKRKKFFKNSLKKKKKLILIKDCNMTLCCWLYVWDSMLNCQYI